MATVQQIVQTARLHHMAGRHDEAETLYRQVLSVAPQHAETFYLLGVMAHHRGDHGTALDHFLSAVRYGPGDPGHHYSTAAALRLLGRGSEAVAFYRRAIALDPRHKDSWLGLGHALAVGQKVAGQGTQGKETAAAAAVYRRAGRLEPGDGNARAQLLRLFQQTGHPEEAIALLAEHLDTGKGTVDDWCNYGILLLQVKRPERALAAFQQAVRLNPAAVAPSARMATVFLATYQTDLAEKWARLALDLDPLDSSGHEILGRVFEQRVAYDPAVVAFRNAISLAPGVANLYFNLGMMLEQSTHIPEAAATYGRCVRLDPTLPHVYEKLSLRLSQCQWEYYEEDAGRCLEHVRVHGDRVLPLSFLYIDSTPADQLLCARRTAMAELEKNAPTRASLTFAHPRTGKERLTVGYVSGDFRAHAVAFLIAEVFELHDRNRFRVLGYCTGPEREQQFMRQRLKAGFDQLTVIRDLPVAVAAERVYQDGVDILVDLSGHTRYNRHDLFAVRPAPIQVNYLGYPGTVGADFLDYILVDPVVAPFTDQPHYAERLVQLPHCYQANDRKRVCSDKPVSRAACGLPEDGFVFSCLNHAAKLSPAVFAVWMRLLRAVPGSVLWLLQPDPPVMDNLRRHAAAHGVDSDRLVFAPRVDPPEHLARIPLADLFLDTAPYNAHTTGSDALWQGLPVVTFYGNTFAGRVGASLLRAAGMPELVANSLAEYEALALELARDPGRLAALRARLRAGRDHCFLFDTPRFTRHLERAYEHMWQRWLTGQPPAPFAVSPLP